MKEFVFINKDGKVLCRNGFHLWYLDDRGLKSPDLSIFKECELKGVRDSIDLCRSSLGSRWVSREIKNGKFVYSSQEVLSKLKKFRKNGGKKYVIISEEEDTGEKFYRSIEDGVLSWECLPEDGQLMTDVPPFVTPFNSPEEIMFHIEAENIELWDERTIDELVYNLRSGIYQLREVILNESNEFVLKKEDVIVPKVPEDYGQNMELVEEGTLLVSSNTEGITVLQEVINVLKTRGPGNCGGDLYSIMKERPKGNSFLGYDSKNERVQFIMKIDRYFSRDVFITPFNDPEKVKIHLELLGCVSNSNGWKRGNSWNTNIENIISKLKNGTFKLAKIEFGNYGLINVLPDNDDTKEIPIPDGFKFDSSTENKIILKKK